MACAQKVAVKATQEYAHNVDPFIGVDWAAIHLSALQYPSGLVKVGPDMETFDGRRSGFGYSSNGVILGFSRLHLSGAQGKYGNILVVPVTGSLDLNDIKTPRTDEVAKVGYYAANLTRYQVKAELTSSRRVGFHRYAFPASQQSHVTINVASALDSATHRLKTVGRSCSRWGSAPSSWGRTMPPPSMSDANFHGCADSQPPTHWTQ